MTDRTLPREPWRGSQICGWQIAYGLPWSEFCAARKADGLPACQEHYDDCMDEYGEVRMAPGNALGDLSVPVRLLWEPYDGILPVVPTDEELARYAGILGLVGPAAAAIAEWLAGDDYRREIAGRYADGGPQYLANYVAQTIYPPSFLPLYSDEAARMIALRDSFTREDFDGIDWAALWARVTV